MQMETPSSPRIDRTMSIKSEAAVVAVQELTARFRSLQDRLLQAAEVVDSEGVTLPVRASFFFLFNKLQEDTLAVSFFFFVETHVRFFVTWPR